MLFIGKPEEPSPWSTGAKSLVAVQLKMYYHYSGRIDRKTNCETIGTVPVVCVVLRCGRKNVQGTGAASK